MYVCTFLLHLLKLLVEDFSRLMLRYCWAVGRCIFSDSGAQLPHGSTNIPVYTIFHVCSFLLRVRKCVIFLCGDCVFFKGFCARVWDWYVYPCWHLERGNKLFDRECVCRLPCRGLSAEQWLLSPTASWDYNWLAKQTGTKQECVTCCHLNLSNTNVFEPQLWVLGLLHWWCVMFIAENFTHVPVRYAAVYVCIRL